MKITIPESTLNKWQNIANLLTDVIDVPAALILQKEDDFNEVLIKSQNDQNPFEKGKLQNKNAGMFCKLVISQGTPLQISNAKKDPYWSEFSKFDHDMISYLGYPLMWPDGKIFGAICILDNKEHSYKSPQKNLISEFANTINSDIANIAEAEARDKLLIELSQSTPKKFHKILRYISFSLAGIIALVLFSSFQKLIIGAPITLMGYIVPVFFGGLTGLIISVLFEKSNQKAKILCKALNKLLGSEEIRLKADSELLENETRYRTLYETANDGILIFKDNKIVESNSKGLELFGFESKDEIIGLTPVDLAPAEQPNGQKTLEFTREKLKNAYKGTPQNFNFLQTRKDGTQFNAGISLNTIILKKELHAQAIVRDITERVQSRNKILESESRFRSLFEGLGDAVYVTVLGGENLGKILEANPAAVRQTGYSKSELLRMNIIKDLYLPGSRKLQTNEWEKLIQQKELITSTEQKIRKDGSVYWTEVLVTPIIFKGQDACLSINRDITSRIQAEEDLKKALHKAKESDRLKTVFLESMSHEIRTPLNAIIGFSNLITQNTDDVKLKEYASIINKQNDLLLTLVNDILDFAQLESGVMEIDRRKFDISNLVDELYMIFERRTTPETKLKPVKQIEPLLLRSDQNRIKQVFSNLISNAFKFTPKGEIKFGYELNDDGDILCFVKDTGIGISKEQHENIFNRFVKLDTFTQGSGLGLSISKKLVNAMDGEMWIESEQGKGSEFYFTIPMDAQKTEDVPTENTVIEEVDVPVEEATIEAEVDTILVAEDNMDNFLYIEQLLISQGMKVLHAKNGLEAVGFIKTDKSIDLILMDIKMPEMNGYEATKLIKDLKPDSTIIALTAHALPVDKEIAIEAGCDAYLPKPINRSELYSAINEHIKKAN